MRRNIWAVAVIFLVVFTLVIGSAVSSSDTRDIDPKETTTKEPTTKKEETTKETTTEKTSEEETDEESTTTEPEETTSKVPAVTREIDKTKKMVCLTFDDGPYKENTTALLDLVEQYPGTAVTFFELGRLMDEEPEIIQREEALGCEVGAHSYVHKRLSEISAAQIREDFEKQQETFRRILGHDITVYRPPYGRMNSDVHEQIGAPLIIWTIDTLDWKYDNTQTLIDTIKKEGADGALDGKVVLMHSSKKSTVEAMKTIFPWLLDEGYQLVTVTEMAEIGYDTKMEAGKDYGYRFFKGREPADGE